MEKETHLSYNYFGAFKRAVYSLKERLNRLVIENKEPACRTYITKQRTQIFDARTRLQEVSKSGVKTHNFSARPLTLVEILL